MPHVSETNYMYSADINGSAAHVSSDRNMLHQQVDKMKMQSKF